MLAWSPITVGLYQPLPPLEIDHHTWDYFPTLYEQCVGFFNVPRNLYVQGLWDRAYGLSSLSKKTRKFIHYFVSFTCMHNFGEQTRQVWQDKSHHVPGLSLRARG